MLKNTQSFSVHDLNEFSHHCKIETLIKCSPFKYVKSNQPLNPLSFDKFIWDPNASPEKLVTALTGKEFTIMAKNIQEKSYPLSLIGTNMFLDDVSEMLKYLHVQSCKLIKVGKKNLAIFYGAGHLADMEHRLIKDFAMKRTQESWVAAWSLKPVKKRKARQP